MNQSICMNEKSYMWIIEQMGELEQAVLHRKASVNRNKNMKSESTWWFIPLLQILTMESNSFWASSLLCFVRIASEKKTITWVYKTCSEKKIHILIVCGGMLYFRFKGGVGVWIWVFSWIYSGKRLRSPSMRPNRWLLKSNAGSQPQNPPQIR